MFNGLQERANGLTFASTITRSQWAILLFSLKTRYLPAAGKLYFFWGERWRFSERNGRSRILRSLGRLHELGYISPAFCQSSLVVAFPGGNIRSEILCLNRLLLDAFLWRYWLDWCGRTLLGDRMERSICPRYWPLQLHRWKWLTSLFPHCRPSVAIGTP